MRNFGRFSLRHLDPKTDRDLNRLARRAQAVDEPVAVVGSQQIRMFERDGGIWIEYGDGTGAWLDQYCGDYDEGRLYRPGQRVRLGPIHAQCIRQTYDSPEIYPVGDSEWLSGLPPDSSSFSYQSDSVSVKRRGQEYRLDQGKHYRVSKIGFMCPHDATTQSYSIWREKLDPFDNEWDQLQIVGRFTSTAKGTWAEVNYVELWEAGSHYRMMLNIISESTPTSFSGYWQQKNENGSPSSGEMIFQNSETEMRFHKTDENDQDQTAGLEAVPVGATIQRGSTVWTVDAVDIRGSHVRYNVSPGGQRGSEEKYTFTFQWGAATDLYHAQDSGFWSSEPSILGIAQDDNGDVFEGKNQFMLDINVQEVAVSDDWDILSLY